MENKTELGRCWFSTSNVGWERRRRNRVSLCLPARGSWAVAWETEEARNDGFAPCWNKEVEKHPKREWAKPWVILIPMHHSWVGVEGLLPPTGLGDAQQYPLWPLAQRI